MPSPNQLKNKIIIKHKFPKSKKKNKKEIPSEDSDNSDIDESDFVHVENSPKKFRLKARLEENESWKYADAQITNDLELQINYLQGEPIISF